MPTNSIKDIFFKNLCKYLISANMTYSDLAEALKISKSTISMWKSGKSLPRMELLDEMADLFHVSVASFFIDEDNYLDLTGLNQEKLIELLQKESDGKISGLKMTLDGEVTTLVINNEVKEPQTIAAHFDGDEFTEEELQKIQEYANFVKSQRDPDYWKKFGETLTSIEEPDDSSKR